MAYQHLEDFGKRVDRINKRHGTTAGGYVTVVRNDRVVAKQPRRSQFRFPWRFAAFVAMTFFVFKGLLMVGLGEAEYAERTLRLQAGTTVEQVGAWAMQPDPVTMWIAEQIRAIM